MPKIIENPEGRLVAEARRQIEENGYSAVTIRSVAKACGMGVGTVYNYFPSKEALLAGYLLEDWKGCVRAIEAVGTYAETPKAVLRCIHDQLLSYAARNSAVFQDEGAAGAFAGSHSRYHGLLRSQLAAPIRRFCRDDFTAEFIAEALLTWTMAGKTFQELYPLLQPFFDAQKPL